MDKQHQDVSMFSIAVVILNYNNMDITVNYINCLNKLNWENIRYKIIVVDNASPDSSGKELFSKYKNDNSIHFILSDHNLGFSKGNNLGITYAYNRLHANLIVVSNNDIEIEDVDFFQKLKRFYNEKRFAVLGPDILSLAKKIHQSPIRANPISRQELEELIDNYQQKMRILGCIRFNTLYEILRKMKRLLKQSGGARQGVESHKEQWGVVVHGAFFVLSEEYMSKYRDGLFPDLFMYMEEDALAYRCRACKLSTVYIPELQVLHYDGVATRRSNGGNLGKYKFELKNTIESAKIILDRLESGKFID